MYTDRFELRATSTPHAQSGAMTVTFSRPECVFILQGGPKNRTVLRVDNFATVSARKACDMSKVYKLCLEETFNACVPVRLNILC